MGSGFTHPPPKLNLKSSAAFPYPLSCSTYTELVPAEKTSVCVVSPPPSSKMFRLPLIEEQICHLSALEAAIRHCSQHAFFCVSLFYPPSVSWHRSHHVLIYPVEGSMKIRVNGDTLCVLMRLYGVRQRWNLLQHLNAAFAVGCDGFERSLCWQIIGRKVQGQSKE